MQHQRATSGDSDQTAARVYAGYGHATGGGHALTGAGGRGIQ